MKEISDVRTEGRLPQNAEITPVQLCLRHDADAPQIQVEAAISSQHSSRHFNLPPVSGGAGEVLYAGIGVIRPGDESLQCQMFRGAPALGESQFPRSPDLDG